MEQKMDRNQPCPCKSGLKPEECCLPSCCEVCLFSKENLGALEAGWTLQRSLIRQNKKHHLPLCPLLMEFQPKTVVICGSGSVYWHNPDYPNEEINTWEIIQTCVDQIKGSPEGRGAGIPSRKENFLHWLAATEKLVTYFTEAYPPHASNYEQIQQVHKKFRELLGQSFQGADIRLRSLTCFHCNNTHGLDPKALNTCGFLTLNWDGAVRQLSNTIELHGICELPETMVLPNQDLTRLLPKNRTIRPGFEAFASAHHWLTDCTNIIIWGCQLNDYDAIISVIMSIFSLTKARGKIGLFVSNRNASTRENIETKLKDYFPLATVYQCLNEINFS